MHRPVWIVERGATECDEVALSFGDSAISHFRLAHQADCHDWHAGLAADVRGGIEEHARTDVEAGAVEAAGRNVDEVDTLVSGKGNSRTLEMVSTHCAHDTPAARAG
jgi:hypothetical protein